MLNQEEIPAVIFGRKLVLKFEDVTALEMGVLARELDKKMQEVSASTNVVDSGKVAILTALTFLHELHKLQEKLKTLGGIEDKKLDSMIVELQKSVEGEP